MTSSVAASTDCVLRTCSNIKSLPERASTRRISVNARSLYGTVHIVHEVMTVSNTPSGKGRRSASGATSRTCAGEAAARALALAASPR